MKNGIIITFEGPDGAGKTTVLEKVLPVLQEKDYDIVTTVSLVVLKLQNAFVTLFQMLSMLRWIVKQSCFFIWQLDVNTMLKKVLPALEAGKVVLIDRFIDSSSVVYQGAGRGLDKDIIAKLNEFSTDGREPDLTLYFDVESEIGLARIAKNADREVNRLDLEKLDMHKRVRQGYLALAQTEERIVTIDASRNLDQVVAEATQVILEQLS